MKAIAIAAAAAALTGCNLLGIGKAGNNSAGNSAAGNGSAGGGNATEAMAAQLRGGASDGKDSQGADPAAGGGGAAVAFNRDFLVGSWTDDGDCAHASEFTSDGRFIGANGVTAIWNLAGDRLTVTGQTTITIQIVPIDENTVTGINPDGSLGRSTRC